MAVPSEDEYLAWREDPTTRFVFGVSRKRAHEVFNGWVDATWATGQIDQQRLTEARTRVDAYLAPEQMDYSDVVAAFEAKDGDIPLPQRRDTYASLQAQALMDDIAFNERTRARHGLWACAAPIFIAVGIVIGHLL